MSTANRRAREKEQRKTDMLDAAEKLFFSRGYDNVSMNDIAKEVELNRATLYLYFENKEALCFGVILRGVKILNQMVKNHVNSATHSQKISAFGTAYSLFLKTYPQYISTYNLFQSGRFDLSSLKRPARDDVREILNLQKEIFNILQVTIKNLRGSVISSDVDSLYATILIMSTMDSMLNPSPFLEREFQDMNVNEYQHFNTIFLSFINKLLKKE